MTENTLPAPLSLQMSVASVTFAHQAILDHNGAIVAYELFDRSTLANGHTASSDAQMLFNVLSAVDSQSPIGNKTIFLNCTHDSLAGGHLDLIAPERVVLEIPPLPVSEVDQIRTRLPQLQDLQRKGFRLAFDYSVLTHSYAPWLELAAFIKFDVSVIRAQSIASFVKLARAKSKAQLVAEKVETPAQHAMLSELGVQLFQGYWFAKPVLVQGQSVRPAQAIILQLINLVRKQASTSEIEEVLKHDPTLSFNLLRFINSAGFGVRTEVTSFKHAVMLLGLNRLFKWAALLLTTSRNGDVPPAVGTTAVVRGRLMELLATESSLPQEDSDNAFVVGVFSLLDTMLGISMEEGLASVTLPDSVTQALLHRTGPLAPFLELTIACETGDDEAFARNAELLGLNNNQVNWNHVQALAWAETMGV
jgi:c-di-GMP-related signal transduction protein